MPTTGSNINSDVYLENAARIYHNSPVCGDTGDPSRKRTRKGNDRWKLLMRGWNGVTASVRRRISTLKKAQSRPGPGIRTGDYTEEINIEEVLDYRGVMKLSISTVSGRLFGGSSCLVIYW